MKMDEVLDHCGSQDPRGPIPVALFLSYSAPNIEREDKECEEMLDILDL